MSAIRLTLAIVLICCVNAGTVMAETEDDYGTAYAQPADERGFPWLCLATSIVALAGTAYFVVRRGQKDEADFKSGRKKIEVPWYCRTCDRDLVGSECPRCHALNPFQHEIA
jgi:hypothetical protein